MRKKEGDDVRTTWGHKVTQAGVNYAPDYLPPSAAALGSPRAE